MPVNLLLILKCVLRKVRSVVAFLFRAMFTAGSANWITVKGKRVSSKEAPILVGAPHTSFFDALVVLTSGPATVVGKVEAAAIPFYGSKLMKHIAPSTKCNMYYLILFVQIPPVVRID